MRCLLDENMSPAVGAMLTDMGHPTLHVSDLGLLSSNDGLVLAAAGDFDALITLDLFQQPSVWQLARRAMLSGVRIIRLRFSAGEKDDLAAQLRALRRAWPEVVERMGSDSDVRLAVISQSGELLRFRNVSQIRAMRRLEPR